jgi:hypothetical protein
MVRRCRGVVHYTAGKLNGYAVEAGDIFMPAVIAALEMDIQEDKKASCHADGKSGYIDQGEEFVFEEVPVGDLEIILQHIDDFGVGDIAGGNQKDAGFMSF